jgi:DNA gyrase subunit B
LKWNGGYSEDLLPYTNNIFQKDGGTHVLGFRSALTRIINKYANEHNLLKKNKLAISGDDIKEGLTCVLSTLKSLIQNFHLKLKINWFHQKLE